MKHVWLRADAVELLCQTRLTNLSKVERAEYLDSMRGEAWEEDLSWPTVPQNVRDEFAACREIKDPSDCRYDAVLLIRLRYEYIGYRNKIILERIRGLRPEIKGIEGTPEELYACPCCGYRTLENRADYDICQVCWWEDEGADNHNAGSCGGPNHINLIWGRINFLTYGIAKPEREDLRRHQISAECYVKGREFVLDESGMVVSESAARWCAEALD